MSEILVLPGIVFFACSGVPGLFLSRMSLAGQRISALLSATAAGLGLTGVGVFWQSGVNRPILEPLALLGAEFHISMNGLSALFLVPVFLVPMLGTIFGLEYWKQCEHPPNGRKLRSNTACILGSSRCDFKNQAVRVMMPGGGRQVKSLLLVSRISIVSRVMPYTKSPSVRSMQGSLSRDTFAFSVTEKSFSISRFLWAINIGVPSEP